MTTVKMAKAKLLIAKEEIPVLAGEIEQTKLQFFPDNPRIYSLVHVGKKAPTQDEIEEQLLDMDHVKALYHDIRRNGGLIDPVIVRDGTFEVLEGNSRLAAYRELCRKDDPIKWARIKCLVLPKDIGDAKIFHLLGQYHVKGKKDWSPFEKAGFLYRRHEEHGLSLEMISSEVGLSEKRVKGMIETYKFMREHGEARADKWSHFEEYLKSRKIQKARDQYAGLDKLVVEKIKKGTFDAVEVRDKLSVVATAPKVLKKFAERKIDLEEAFDSVENSGGTNGAYQRLHKFRTWFVAEEVAEALEGQKGEARDKLLFELKRIAKRAKDLLASDE